MPSRLQFRDKFHPSHIEVSRSHFAAVQVRSWLISEVAARLIEGRSVGHSRLALLTLSSSRFDPRATLRAIMPVGPAVARRLPDRRRARSARSPSSRSQKAHSSSTGIAKTAVIARVKATKAAPLVAENGDHAAIKQQRDNRSQNALQGLECDIKQRRTLSTPNAHPIERAYVDRAIVAIKRLTRVCISGQKRGNAS